MVWPATPLLSMGAVFALFAGFYYWIHKIVGAQYSEKLAQLHFWTFFCGVNITFFPMHFLGLAGMPRRISDYPDGFAEWNFICTFGSNLSVVGLMIFLAVVAEVVGGGQNIDTQRRKVPEFSVESLLRSPPSYHAFAERPAIKDSSAIKNR